MLATFSVPNGGGIKCYPLLCCVGFFLIFRRLDPILAPFGLHFGAPGCYLSSILEALLARCWHHSALCWAHLAREPGLNGLVGLREALRILLLLYMLVFNQIIIFRRDSFPFGTKFKVESLASVRRDRS